MKKTGFLSLGLGLAVAFASANTASAIDIPFDPDGPGPLKFLGSGAPAGIAIPKLTGLDWAPGNALAQGSVPLTVGDTFTTYYQAKLSVFNIDATAGFGTTATNFNDGSGLVSGIGTLSAPATFEWTVVARFEEKVTSIVGDAAFFEVVNNPDNYLKVFFDSTPDANDLAGTGFTDGLEILSASIVVQDNGGFDINGGGVLDETPASGASVHGSGSFNVLAIVDSWNNAFLDLDSIGILPGQLQVTLITSTLELPFGPADVAGQFEVVGGPAVVPDRGLVNGVDGPDFQFEADANQTFSLVADVPEPATAALGLIGLGALLARRRRMA